jgi:hypothetical protein
MIILMILLQVFLGPAAAMGSSSGPVNLEKIIDFKDWVVKRGFELNTRLHSWRDHPLYSSQIHVQRISPKISMERDEFRYVEAYYGCENCKAALAVGVKVSESTVNRKDSPFGIDEKQVIQISATPPTYQMYNFTLPTGSTTDITEFRVKVGGKYSRSLRANASESEFISALRELFSDCDGTGAYDDGGGQAWDCWQGAGLMYRGLVCIPFLCVSYLMNIMSNSFIMHAIIDM